MVHIKHCVNNVLNLKKKKIVHLAASMPSLVLTNDSIVAGPPMPFSWPRSCMVAGNCLFYEAVTTIYTPLWNTTVFHLWCIYWGACSAKLIGVNSDYIIPQQTCKSFYTAVFQLMAIFFVCWKFLSIKILYWEGRGEAKLTNCASKLE